MDIKHTVINTFMKTIDEAQVNSELKYSLKTHPRVTSVIQNIYKELLSVEAARAVKNKPRLKESTIKQTTKEFAEMFIKGISIECDRRIESDLARIAREQEQQRAKELENTANGQASGEYAELQEQGLTIGETVANG